MARRDDDADERESAFELFAWSEGLDDEDAGLDGAAHGLNGHDRHGPGAREEERDGTDAEAGESGWVDTGGILRWEEPGEVDDPRAEPDSPLAADDLDLPAGAPDTARLRAVHAWMLRRRAGEHEALGSLLLAQREQRAREGDGTPPPGERRRKRHGEPEVSPLELDIAEHQAAADEYGALLEALDDHVAHSGPGRVLVEFFLWMSEHLSYLAQQPEAASAGEPPRTLAAAAWLGRAQAALAARTRVERMTSPDVDD